MAHGVKTGGRRKGSRNKVTAALVAKAQASGELPHEFLLRVSRGESIHMAGQRLKYKPTFQERIDAAKAAAEFYAPRLARTEQKISGGLDLNTNDGSVASKLLPELAGGRTPAPAGNAH